MLTTPLRFYPKYGPWIVALLLALGVNGNTLSAFGEPATYVGKLVILRGSAAATNLAHVRRTLKEGSPVYAGETIGTAAQSQAKIVFSDFSEVSLGPESAFFIDRFDNKSTSVFTVLAGRLRAKITKWIGAPTKAVVRTPSAVMGVRGTEFETVFNRTTRATSLLTYEGTVALIGANEDQRLTRLSDLRVVDEISRTLNDETRAVLVTQGFFAGVSTQSTLPTIPVRVSPAQLETLRSSSGLAPVSPSDNARAASGPKRFISPVPPGVDARAVGAGGAPDGKLPEPAPNPSVGAPPAEGYYDARTGRVAPPAGGLVDLNTGLYIPPPPGSAFDPVSGVYVPPPSMGSFNPANGAYVPPTGFALDPTRGFVPAPAAGTLGTKPVLPQSPLPPAGATTPGGQATSAPVSTTSGALSGSPRTGGPATSAGGAIILPGFPNLNTVGTTNPMPSMVAAPPPPGSIGYYAPGPAGGYAPPPPAATTIVPSLAPTPTNAAGTTPPRPSADSSSSPTTDPIYTNAPPPPPPPAPMVCAGAYCNPTNPTTTYTGGTATRVTIRLH